MGQEVMTRNLRPGPKYVTGVVVQKLRPLSYLVEAGDGFVWRRHSTTGDKAKEIKPDLGPSDPKEFFPIHLSKQLGQTFPLLRVVMILFLLLPVPGCGISRHKGPIKHTIHQTGMVV